MARPRAVDKRPDGFVYRPELFSRAEERALLDELDLEPRSGYDLAGEARTAWQHHLPPAKALRYSITFRTLRRA